MSKKKARLIICSNIHFNQYFNLYLHKKPLINKLNKLKEINTYYNLNNETNYRESLQYQIIQSYSIYINNYKNMYKINSIVNVYLKKYFSNLLHYGNININLDFEKNSKKNIYYNFYINKLNITSSINYKYKSTSNYFIKKNRTVYNEIQNENKLLSRKVNINKYQILI